MSHEPESRTRHEAASRDDLSTVPEASPSGESCTSDDSVDLDAIADRPRHQSNDPYQPL